VTGSQIPLAHQRALIEIHRRLQDIRWAITGSVGLALQGVDVEVHDIDLQADAPGAYAIERCLSEFVTRPVRFSEAARVRSYFGALSVLGISVEIMGEVQTRAAGGAWQEPPDMQIETLWVQAFGLQLPVLSLTWEQQAYLRRGILEKALLIEQYLEAHPHCPGRRQGSGEIAQDT